MLALNKRFDQCFDQLLKLHEESTRATTVSMTRREKETLGPRMGGNSNSKGTSISGDFHRDFQLRKLKMPTFDGTNPNRWIIRVERYFGPHLFSNE